MYRGGYQQNRGPEFYQIGGLSCNVEVLRFRLSRKQNFVIHIADAAPNLGLVGGLGTSLACHHHAGFRLQVLYSSCSYAHLHTRLSHVGTLS